MKVVVIAWWFGTRMLPIAKSIPKEMLPVGDKPIIQYTVDGLVEAGITDIIMITSQQKKPLEDYFDSNYQLEDILQKKWKLKELEAINKPKNMANYSFVKQLQVLGTWYALLHVEHLVSEDYFMVVFPDTIYPPETLPNMVKLFNEKKCSILAVHEVPREEVYRYGVVKLDGDRVVDFVEKPKVEDAPSNLIRNGAVILHKDIFKTLRNISFDARSWELHIPDGIKAMLQDYPMISLPCRPYLDTWTNQWLLEANAKLYNDGYLFSPL